MNYIDFCNEFNSSSDKVSCMKNHIVNTYIGFLKKDTLCKNIISKTNERKIGERTFKQQNSSAAYLFYRLTLIKSYTDIDVDLNDPESIYDELQKNGVFDVLIGCIDKNELDEFNNILQMAKDDYFENYRSMSSVLDIKFDALMMYIDAIIPKNLKEK